VHFGIIRMCVTAASQPFGKPFGKPFGEPFGGPFGEPFGEPFALPVPPHAIGAVSVFAGGHPARLHDLDADLARYFGVEGGVLVLDGTADEASLRSGDVLVSIAGRKPADAAQAQAWLARRTGPVEVEVLRDRESRTVSVDAASFSGPTPGARVIRLDQEAPPAH
jgi:hypothetical protein